MSAITAKKILITGTSTGVGAALAVSLAKKGHTVWATMRNLGKQQPLLDAATAAGVSLTVKQLDVESADSVKSCVNEMISSVGAIDVLVNNAGAGFLRTAEQATDEEVKWVMEVNYFGTVRCIKEVMPYMRAAGSGHVINVTSVGGLVGQPFNELYCAAKFAVEGLTESMASYVTPAFGINFTAVEPGGIATEFVNSVMANIASTGGMRADEYAPLIGMYMETRKNRSGEEGGPKVFQTAQEVADVIVACIETENPPVRMRTSEWAEKFCSLKTATDPDGKKLQNEIAVNVLGAKSATELK